MTFTIFLIICSLIIYAICYVIVLIKSKETLRFKGYSQIEINKKITYEAIVYTIVAILIFVIFGQLTTIVREQIKTPEEDQYIIPETHD